MSALPILVIFAGVASTQDGALIETGPLFGLYSFHMGSSYMEESGLDSIESSRENRKRTKPVTADLLDVTRYVRISPAHKLTLITRFAKGDIDFSSRKPVEIWIDELNNR